MYLIIFLGGTSLVAFGLIMGLRKLTQGKREKRVQTFVNNVKNLTESVVPEVAGYHIGIACESEESMAIFKKEAKELGKAAGKAIIATALTGKAGRVHTGTSERKDYYLVRYKGTKMYLFNIGPYISLTNLELMNENILCFTPDIIKEANINMTGKVSLSDHHQSFIFNILSSPAVVNGVDITPYSKPFKKWIKEFVDVCNQ